MGSLDETKKVLEDYKNEVDLNRDRYESGEGDDYEPILAKALEAIQSIVDRSLGQDKSIYHPDRAVEHGQVVARNDLRQQIRKDWGIDAR